MEQMNALYGGIPAVLIGMFMALFFPNKKAACILYGFAPFLLNLTAISMFSDTLWKSSIDASYADYTAPSDWPLNFTLIEREWYIDGRITQKDYVISNESGIFNVPGYAVGDVIVYVHDAYILANSTENIARSDIHYFPMKNRWFCKDWAPKFPMLPAVNGSRAGSSVKEGNNRTRYTLQPIYDDFAEAWSQQWYMFLSWTTVYAVLSWVFIVEKAIIESNKKRSNDGDVEKASNEKKSHSQQGERILAWLATMAFLLVLLVINTLGYGIFHEEFESSIDVE